MGITYDMPMRQAKGVQSFGVLAIVALLAFAPGFASAKHDKNGHGDNGNASSTEAQEPPKSAGISKDQAIEIAQHRYKARVVRADASETGGRRTYVLRMLSEQGRVWTVRMDAQTGNEF
jgi:uncharacterized membrane protein YkoI